MPFACFLTSLLVALLPFRSFLFFALPVVLSPSAFHGRSGH
ncbi:putative membrane protein [Chlamydia ibidis]|uniref:Putative membrane protein n=1 Tax=Chlamydia ibidis TaxID=1405396 RepID=S7J5N2_9CHLA|nr:putative membrane protein [Chlamydia ibidis]